MAVPSCSTSNPLITECGAPCPSCYSIITDPIEGPVCAHNSTPNCDALCFGVGTPGSAAHNSCVSLCCALPGATCCGTVGVDPPTPDRWPWDPRNPVASAWGS